MLLLVLLLGEDLKRKSCATMADKGGEKGMVMLERGHPIVVDTLTELFAPECVGGGSKLLRPNED